MITVSMPVFGMSAAIAVGIIAVDLAQSRAPEMSPAATVAARFPQSHEKLAVPAPAQPAESSSVNKADRLPVPVLGCTHEHWPYLADECLVSTTGAPVRKPIRTIPFERRIADNETQLEHLKTITLASR